MAITIASVERTGDPMGDKSPKAKARAKKQELRMKSEKRAAQESKAQRPQELIETPKAS
jgi:hypothetical protein